MHHCGRSEFPEGRRDRGLVADVDPTERITRARVNTCQGGGGSGVCQLVEVKDAMFGRTDQATNDGTTNKSGAAGDKNSHQSSAATPTSLRSLRTVTLLPPVAAASYPSQKVLDRAPTVATRSRHLDRSKRP